MRINGDLEFFAIDGAANSIKNAFFERVAGGVGGVSLPLNGGAATGAAGAGRLVYNTDDNAFYFYNGTTWQEVGTGGGAAGIQAELDDTQASMGYVNTDGTFNASTLNALSNVTGLTGGDTLVDALTQLDAAITNAAGVDTLGELTDVTLAGLAAGDVLYSADGSTFVNATPNAAGLVTLAGTQTISGAKTFSAVATFSEDIAAKAGTAADPAIHFGGDTDTGFYQLGPNAIGVSIGNTGGNFWGDVLGDHILQVGGVGVNGYVVAGDGGQIVGPLSNADGQPGLSFGNSSGNAAGVFYGSDFLGGGEAVGMGFKDANGGVIFGAFGGETGYLAHNDPNGNGIWDALTYETNVANGEDYAIPNKLYVDNAIAAASINNLDEIGDVNTPSPTNNNFLVYNTTPGEWQDFTPAEARTALGLNAGGVGDIWVEKAGDTMTGDLVMSNSAVIQAELGTAALPSVTFTGDTDTGMSAAVANELVLSAGGTALLTLTATEITASQEILAPAGSAANPAFSFSVDPDTGMFRSLANQLSLVTNGTTRLNVEENGTLNVGDTVAYENLVTDDDDIPNKKYVDDQIVAGVGATSLDLLTDTTLVTPVSNDTLQYVSAGSAFITSQDETNFDGVGSNGTFTGGTGYVVADTIVLDDDGSANPGTVVTVDAVSGGVITQFTVTTPSNFPTGDSVTRSQASTSGVGTGFTLTPGTNNLTALAPEWHNVDPAGARSNLGLIAGGAGDIWVEKAGDTMSGNLNMDSNLIVNVGDPVSGADAVNKAYVDNIATGLSVKAAVKVATTANLAATYDNGTSGVGATLTASANGAWPGLDGVTTGFALNDGILVKDQTNAFENGRYFISDLGSAGTPWVLTRCGTCDEADEIPSAFVFVQQGTTYGNTGWAASVDNPTTFVVGTDDIDWVQFSGSGAINAGVGLSLTGTTLNVNLGAGIVDLPSDEVGIDLFDAATGALILTTDGTARTSGTGAQLHLLLDSNASLVQGAGGLSVAATTFAGDTGSDATVLPGETITFAGANAISTTVTTNNVQIDVATATTAASQGAGTLGVAEFFGTDFSVTSGFVELNPVGVQESVSFTFSPITGDDIVLTGTTDTLNINSTTLTVAGTVGTSTIDIDLNAVLSDLNDVSGDLAPYGGGEFTAPVSTRDLIGAAYDDWFVRPSDGNLVPYNVNPTPFSAGLVTPGLHRGAQILVWDTSAATGTPGADDEYGQWTSAWSDSLLNASGLGAFHEWEANRSYFAPTAADHYAYTGAAWSGAEGATAVFARWDTTTESWRNFTPAQMVTMLNTQGGLTGVTATFDVAGDTGTPQTITTGVDTVTIAGGTGIDTVAGATDTVTVSLNASVGDLNDVTLSGASAAGDVLVWDGGNNDFRDVQIHYVETTAVAGTSHTITHNLNQQYVNVTIADTSDQVIIPQSITFTDANTVTVTLSSSANITAIVTGVPGV
jgi:hypothetical protein